MGWIAFLLILCAIAYALYRLAFSPGRQPVTRERSDAGISQVLAQPPPPLPVGRAERRTSGPVVASSRPRAAVPLPPPLPPRRTTVAPQPTAPVKPPSVVHPPAASSSPLSFIGSGRAIRVADLVLREPLIYVTSSAAASEEEPAAVDVGLPVARQRYEPAQRELPYWPRYGPLTPGQRRIYLEWIAGGRRTIPPELGYTFLFIYGLERRTLVDQADQKVVFDEVVRLRALYEASGTPASRSFDSYTASFLWHLVVRFPQIIQLKRVQPLMRSTRGWTEENLAAALSWFAANSMPLPDWAAYVVARELPRSQRSVVITRVGEELEKLFRKRYVERFRHGLQLRVSKRDFRFSYRPASAALSSMQVSAPNPIGIASQFEPLSDLWNECIQELRKLSSVVARENQETVTVAAWEAMPDELRAGIDHPLTDAFCALVNGRADDTGRAVVEAGKAAAALGLRGLTKLTPAQGRKVCETAGQIGYCLEPDARLTGKG